MMKLRSITKITIPAVVLAVAVLAVFAASALAVTVDVDGKFSLFGNGAQWVTAGIRPDEAAADLTSNCGAEVYNATCYSDPTFTYSGVAFTVKPGHAAATLANITTLSTAYNMNGTDCSGGSPRFVIFTTAANYEVNIGNPPYGGGCYYGWQNTGNITSATDPTLRWQVNVGNTFYSWSSILSAHGTEQVTEIDIVLDGGWIATRGQDVTIDRFTVNDTVMQGQGH